MKNAVKTTKSVGGSTAKDVVKLVLDDHKILKKLAGTMMSSTGHGLEQRQEAYKKFEPLWLSHANAEEKTLYRFIEKDEAMRGCALECSVEHMLADELIEMINSTDEEDLWSARVAVLGSLIKRHIKEEEEEMLPDFREISTAEDRIMLGKEYLVIKSKQIPRERLEDSSQSLTEPMAQH